ncbi:MAG: aldose 1-epimerase [Candidatus Thermoplasmatota archaeon]|nr:aldose 1-epimerase [Candidatus Thermoplasmatota archaeon]
MTIDGRWKYNDMQIVFLRSDDLQITIIPELGGVIWSIKHLRTDREFLSQVREPRPLSYYRDLYPTKNLLDICLIGGWYEVLPNVGYYSQYNGAEFGLHEETAYLPWKLEYDESANPDTISMKVQLTKYPLEIVKRIRLRDEHITIEEKLLNKSDEELKFAWLHHPTFGGDMLDDGTELIIEDCEFEIDSYLPTTNASLEPGYRGLWPHGKNKSKEDVDLSKYPGKGDTNCDDLIYIPKMKSGKFLIQNNRKKMTFSARWDKDIFPTLWIWRALGGGNGYPWYGSIYATAIEISTSYPATGLADQCRMGTASTISGRKELKTVFEFEAKVM